MTGADVMRILVTTVLAMQSVAAGTPIGVATASSDGHMCVAMPAPALMPGTTLTLIDLDARQSPVVATIVRRVPGCDRLERALIPEPFYVAEVTTSTTSDSGTVWVAFSGRLKTHRLGSGPLMVQVSAAYPNAQVRSCTSREGLHLTVWSGTPLKSQRLWHVYYYLGYDVEPSCDDLDVKVAR